MHTVINTHQIDADDPLKTFRQGIGKFAAIGSDPSIVDHHIDRTEGGFGLRLGRLPLLPVADIKCNALKLATPGAEHRCQRLRVDIGQRHAHAALGQGITNAKADAARPAADEGVIGR